MERKKFNRKSRLIYTSSPAAPPPSPIPTARGSRSAADPLLSDYIDKSAQIPALQLPEHVNKFKPEEINYELLVFRERDSLRRLLKSAREFGVFRISNHGIATEELRFALASSERIFGITVECCTSYGDHEKIVWHGDDRRIMEQAAAAAIGVRNYHIFCEKMENVGRKLEGMAEELGKIIVGKQIEESVEIGESTSTLSIYRYHRANINDRSSSVIGEIIQQESSLYSLSLHLLLEPSEFCLQSSHGNLSFDTSSETLVVTIGKELQEWSHGELKSAQGKIIFKPFLQTNRPSFSIEQKWSASNLRKVVRESDKIISLTNQIFFLLVVAFLFNAFAYIFA
ncbi:hypothetical protein ABFS83_10G005700 [Erythranthe nasuta]